MGTRDHQRMHCLPYHRLPAWCDRALLSRKDLVVIMWATVGD